MKRRLPLALGICMLGQVAPADGEPTRSVAGIVVNAEGAEVPSASVVALPIAESGVGASLHWSPVDDKGRFKLNLPHGHYQFLAKDEQHGYPNPTFLLSADPSSRFPVVTVENADIDGVRVILGEQGGMLRIHIRGQDSQEPIAGAKAILRDAHDARALVELSADGHGNIESVVPHKALVIVVYAPGYFKKESQGGEEVELSKGERRDITFELMRE